MFTVSDPRPRRLFRTSDAYLYRDLKKQVFEQVESLQLLQATNQGLRSLKFCFFPKSFFSVPLDFQLPP